MPLVLLLLALEPLCLAVVSCSEVVVSVPDWLTTTLDRLTPPAPAPPAS